MRAKWLTPVQAGLGYKYIEKRPPLLPFPLVPPAVPQTQGCFVPAASAPPEAHMLASLSPMLGWVRCCRSLAHLAFGRDLLMVTVRGVPRDLAGPQCDSHYGVCIANHQQGEEVDQHSYTNVVPATKWMGGVSLRNNGDQGLTATFFSICH